MTLKNKTRVEQRHELYKRLLEIVCKDPETNTGFCYYLSWYFGIEIRDLRELYLHKPKRMYSCCFWFPTTSKGWEKRIAILQKCIKQTSSKKIKK